MDRRSSTSGTWTGLVTLSLLALSTSDARADSLEQVCQDLDRTPQTSCSMELSRDDEWVLNTGYHIGTGRKSALEPVETRFCDAARRAGVSGRVQRASELPGTLGEGAVMEWQCDPPAVSSAPKRP
jgi:hypothetical protein